MTARNSLERVIALLDLFSEDRLEWTPEQMMAELGYSRPTLYRYLKTLKEAGFLMPTPSGGYTLGPRVIEMDFLMSRSDALLLKGQPKLDALAGRYPCNALLARWYGSRLLCVASACSASDIQTSYPRGRPMPLARGAISRAIMAFLPRRRLLPAVETNLADLRDIGLGQTTGDILKALRGVRRAGYAIARGEVTPGVVGVAAPVFGGSTTPIAALCITMSRETASRHRIADLGEGIADAARDISEALARQHAFERSSPTEPCPTTVYLRGKA